MNFQFNLDLHWSSDWNGYEVGYPELNVVGLYSLSNNPDIHFYIDMETLTVLESWYICEDCQCSF